MSETQKLRGDEAQLFEEHDRVVRRIVSRNVCTSAANVDDAVNDAWAALMKYQPRRATVRPWLITVAIRRAIDYDRRDRRTNLDDDAVIEAVADAANVVEAMERRERVLEGLERMAELKERHLRAFALHVMGYTYEEIAQEMEITYTAVNRYLMRAAKRVRWNEVTKGYRR